MTNSKFRLVFLTAILILTQSKVVLAFDNTPPFTTVSLGGTIGSNSWYTTTVGVTLTASEDNGEVASTEYWVDSNPHNLINYLPGAPTQVQFNVSSLGTHTVSYFSTNIDGVSEEVKTTSSFKIDTSSPSNWRDFTSTQSGNSHTFILSVTVDDVPSGLDPTSAYYNYTVDGINYGYYTDPSSCSSSFVAQDPNKEPPESGSGWRPVPTLTPNTSGAATMTLTTEAVDFCNSSWNLDEAVQFYIKDLAGNDSYKLQLLFGPWIEVKGAGIHSQGAINFSAQGKADFMVSSGVSPINNFVSNQNWYTAPNSMNDTTLSYDYWYSKLGSPTTSLPGGRLPTVKGLYRVNGDFTIDNGTIPSGLSTTQNFGAVIFINGRLTINANFSLHPSSGLVFIVNDDLRSRQSVDSFAGFYLVDGDIDLSYNGNNSNTLVVTGGLVGSETWRFGKNLTGQNNIASAAEQFVYQPSYLANNDLVGYLSVPATYLWQEVAP